MRKQFGCVDRNAGFLAVYIEKYTAWSRLFFVKTEVEKTVMRYRIQVCKVSSNCSQIPENSQLTKYLNFVVVKVRKTLKINKLRSDINH
tara:strand:+ start:44193 stop:44459 length:267 start_codon:yes stop_codon:yes gene_type:complete